MKHWIVVLMGLVLGTVNAGATEIAGKWGIGASLLNSGFETSLIRGHSDRTAWVLDIAFGGSNSDRTFAVIPGSEVTGNLNSWFVDIGPSLRHFTRPSSAFSPYGDVFVSYLSGRTHRGGATGFPVTSKLSGVSTGIGFGMEYFTRRHCSVAVHTSVVTLAWRSMSRDQLLLGVERNTTSDGFAAVANLEPRLVLRAYF